MAGQGGGPTSILFEESSERKRRHRKLKRETGEEKGRADRLGERR